jgi:hypothetical protein
MWVLTGWAVLALSAWSVMWMGVRLFDWVAG